ncbi:MAG TPA: hypothetical protein VIY90_06425 [Steroidobacteraceae bacterium]
MWKLDGRGFIADTDFSKRDCLNRYIHPDDQPRMNAAWQFWRSLLPNLRGPQAYINQPQRMAIRLFYECKF